MRRFLFHYAGLALCCLPLAASLARAQPFPALDLSFLEIPGAGKQIATPVLPEERAPAERVSPNTGMPVLKEADAAASDKTFPLVELALYSNEYFDARYIANSQHQADVNWREHLCEVYQDQVMRVLTGDLGNFYWSENTICLGLAVAAAAPIANTHADRGIRDWYQRQAGGSPRANDAALFVKNFGEFKYVIPADLALSVAGHLFSDNPYAATVAQFGDRSLRAMIIGAPTVGILQVGLGSDHPYENDSRWHPFKSSHGVSGIAFMGAIPFLTAAEMTEYKSLQTVLFLASFATSWSRIQTDDHYFSQVALGWTIAYLAVRSVNQTEDDWARRVQIVPVPIPNGAGLGVLIKY